MKKVFLQFVAMFVLIFSFSASIAQAPEKMSYQGVIRNSSNALIANKAVSMRISILQGAANGTARYVETQQPTTNANGLVSIQIGAGTVVSGAFAAIDWSAGPYFIKTETDPAGGTSYSISSTSELLSVPYALYAKTAESVVGGGGSGGATYAVGDFAQGGVVFWVDATGQHGLVCAVTDVIGATWYNGIYRNTNSSGDGVYAGEMNTALEIALQTNDNPTTGVFAAKQCADYSIVDGDEFYGDWYLPSKWELNQMYLAQTKINTTSVANGGTELKASFYYWSSTEVNGEGEYYGAHAWYQKIGGDGLQAHDQKKYSLEIRPIRRF